MTTSFPHALRFNKELPGAQTRFQPDTLPLYENTEWDLRISVDQSPLEEAFYITFDQESLLDCTIETVLLEHALNPDNASRLDVANYPELPFVQQELIHFWQASQSGRLTLDIFLNKDPSGQAVSLKQPARNCLSTCTTDNGAFDYRLVDLVFSLQPTMLDRATLNGLRQEYGLLFLLSVLGHYPDQRNVQPFIDYQNSLTHPLPYPHIFTTLEQMRGLDWIKPATTVQAGLQLTENGQQQFNRLWHDEIPALIHHYEPLSSVSIHPPALGVPNGFDIRLQMMEHDGMDPIRGLFLLSFDAEADSLFHSERWIQDFEEGSLFQRLYRPMAYMTGFTTEAIQSLNPLRQLIQARNHYRHE
ncbi:MAG: hypothetical protein HQL54_09430 [Magnetococcales bacterium]|nr:hypothetical protein [Magnetococcales bacterium]